MAKSDPLRQKLVDRYNSALRRMEQNPHDYKVKDEVLQHRRMLRRHDAAQKGKRGADA